MTTTGGATLCAIMKDEKPYILEWVAWHRLIGFDEIVVYSNDCTDGSLELLEALAQARLITHRVVSTPQDVGPQALAYNDALNACGTSWIGFLDADEFLVLKQDATLGEFLDRFAPHVGAVALNWRLFGSSGETAFRPDLVTQRFSRASHLTHDVNRHVKSLVRPQWVEFMRVHAAQLSGGAYVNSNGEPVEIVDFGLIASAAHEVAQVNHYYLKSREEFTDKKRRGDATFGTGDPRKYRTREREDWFAIHDCNEEEDLFLFRRKDAIEAEIDRMKSRLPP